MRKNKYDDVANNIVGLIGGKDNISFFTHCITRLRFTIKDKSKVQEKDVQNLTGVVGINWSGEQLQVIIGQAVADAYKLICERNDFESIEGVKEKLGNSSKEKNKINLNWFLDIISGVVTPVIPVLIASGLLKMVILLLEMAGILKTDSSTHAVLTFAADAGFYFLPVMVGAFAAKKFKANMALGMLMGAMLIHPNFVASVAAGESISVFGLPVFAANYATTIVPVILIVAVMAPIERLIGKYCPNIIRSMLQPLLTLIIMIPIALCVLAPVGSYVGTFLADIFIWLYSTFGFIGVAIVAMLWPVLIVTGMHSALMPYCINAFATIGYDPIVIASSIIHNFSQGGACAAVGLKSKDPNIKAVAISCSTSAIVGGISEPAVYGVTLNYKTPLYCAMFANFIAGAIIGINHVYVMVLGGGGIFGLPIFVAEDPRNLIWAVVACIIAAIVAFISTFIVYKDPQNEEVGGTI